MMPERCMDCARDATYTLLWHPTKRCWTIRKVRWYGRYRQAIHRYCQQHAAVRADLRNARGMVSPMEELRRLLAQQERHE